MQRASAVLQTHAYARKRAQRSVEKGGNRSVPLSLRAQGIAGEKGHGCRALARFGKTLACQSTGKQERGVVEQHVQEREGEKERERERKREREREVVRVASVRSPVAICFPFGEALGFTNSLGVSEVLGLGIQTVHNTLAVWKAASAQVRVVAGLPVTGPRGPVRICEHGPGAHDGAETQDRA